MSKIYRYFLTFRPRSYVKGLPKTKRCNLVAVTVSVRFRFGFGVYVKQPLSGNQHTGLRDSVSKDSVLDSEILPFRQNMGTYSVTCVAKIPSLRSGERSVKTKLIFECFKLNVCENYASPLTENEVRFHLFYDFFAGSTFRAIGQCRPEAEGT